MIGLDWVDGIALDCFGLVGLHVVDRIAWIDWIGMDWIAWIDCIALDCIGLHWIALDCIGLVVLVWIGLDCSD